MTPTLARVARAARAAARASSTRDQAIRDALTTEAPTAVAAAAGLTTRRVRQIRDHTR